jgi:hypothetical protein
MSAVGQNRIRTLTIAVMAALFIVGVPILAYAGTSSFNDVEDDSVFLDDIEWMLTTGITNGCGEDIFCPSEFVPREQMAAFFHRYNDWLMTQPGVGGGGLIATNALSYSTPTRGSDGQTAAYLVGTKEVTVTDGALVVSATATAVGTGAKEDIQGRFWIEIDGDQTCSAYSAANGATFYRKGSDKHHSVADLTALAAASVSAGSVDVDVCTDAVTKKDTTWTLTGNTVIQWAAGWL